MPTAPIPPVPAAPKGWEIDKRQAIGLAIGLLGLGLIIGFRLGAGAEPMIVDRPVDRVVYRETPCADCEEKAKERHPTFDPQQSVPGDSSIPED
jgi:hypothetical protein